MRLAAVKRIALVLASAGIVAACGEEGLAPIPPVNLPLGAGVWYLNTVDDSALGSTVSTRTVGAAQERTVADSGWINVDVDGTYEQRLWTRVFVTGLLDRSETMIDEGNWIASDSGYVFVSAVRTRTFLIVPIDLAQFRTAEPMVTYQNPPLTEGIYRRTRP